MLPSYTGMSCQRACEQNYNCNPLGRICTRICTEPLLTTTSPRVFGFIWKCSVNIMTQWSCVHLCCPSLGANTSLQPTVPHESTTQLKGLCVATVPKAIVRQISSTLSYFMVPSIPSLNTATCMLPSVPGKLTHDNLFHWLHQAWSLLPPA